MAEQGWTFWMIVAIPLIFVFVMAFYTRKYIRGVSDFLVCGRVAGRYVLNVADLENGLSALSLVAMVEIRYQVGYGILFWENIAGPIGIVLSLTGFCIYRYRETKAMSLGQFFEMRYNRAFRVFAATLKTVSSILGSIIGPAVAARFLIYLLGIPHHVMIFGNQVPTFGLIMLIVMIAALSIILIGGSLALLVTDCVQGLISYPIFVIFAVFVLTTLSWPNDVVPVLTARVPGESFCNPYDIQSVRDFNLFALVVTIASRFLNYGSQLGSSNSGAARTAQEQKMASILASLRMGFGAVMCVLLAVTTITVMHHRRFAEQARHIRSELTERVTAEIVADPAVRERVAANSRALPKRFVEPGVTISRKDNFDTPYFDAVGRALPDTPEGKATLLQFRTLYNQMMLPVTMRALMPGAIMGLFCLLLIMLVLSTDDSQLFNTAMTISQDMVLPFIRKSLTPSQHLWLIRAMCLLVGVIFYLGSLLMQQLDYINLFVTIVASIWLGGAGPVMLGGLYTRFGTTTGAFASLLTGGGISVGGILLQRNWPDVVHPFLVEMGWADAVGRFLGVVSAPFNPYIVWVMDPVQCPINSKEFFFFAMAASVTAYVIGSLLTFRRPFNLDRMLHRGKYDLDGNKKMVSPWTWGNLYKKFIGITPEYTFEDKFTVWLTFSYSIIWTMVCLFGGTVIWNAVSPWKAESWPYFVLVRNLISPMLLGVLTTVWFWIGGVVDLQRLFRDLRDRSENPLDDGRVEGSMSLADKAELERRDRDGETDKSGK